MYISLIILEILLFTFAFAYFFGLSKKDRYAFRKHMTEICKKEKIYLHYCDNIDDLNHILNTEMSFNESEKALGIYCNLKGSTDIENIIKKYPRIYLSKKPLNIAIDSFNQTINVMTFAHELGHHFAIKENNDRSERAADRNAVKLFREFFPKYKSLLYIGLIMLYLNRNKND